MSHEAEGAHGRFEIPNVDAIVRRSAGQLLHVGIQSQNVDGAFVAAKRAMQLRIVVGRRGHGQRLSVHGFLYLGRSLRRGRVRKEIKARRIEVVVCYRNNEDLLMKKLLLSVGK